MLLHNIEKGITLFKPFDWCLMGDKGSKWLTEVKTALFFTLVYFYILDW